MAGVVVSEEIPAPRPVVWGWLVPVPPPAAATGASRPGMQRLRLGSTVIDLEVLDAFDGLVGTAVWGGVAHRVSVHLVERGPVGTLLVCTADAQEADRGDEGFGGGGRSALAHRHASRDLRRLVDDVRERAGVPTPTGG